MLDSFHRFLYHIYLQYPDELDLFAKYESRDVVLRSSLFCLFKWPPDSTRLPICGSIHKNNVSPTVVFARKLLPGFPDCSAIDIFFKRAWNRDENGVERSDWDLFKSDRVYPDHMEFVHSTIESLEGTREINVFIAFGGDARKFMEERYGNGTTEVILNETLVSSKFHYLTSNEESGFLRVQNLKAMFTGLEDCYSTSWGQHLAPNIRNPDVWDIVSIQILNAPC